MSSEASFGITESGGCFSCLGHREFYTTVLGFGDKQSRAEALDKIKAYSFEMKNRIEARLGRRLTEREIRYEKTEHPAGDIAAKQQAEIKWQTIFNPPQEQVGNPWSAKIEEHERKKAQLADPDGFWLREQSEKFEAENKRKIESEKREKEIAGNPKAQKCIADARAVALAIRFDSRASDLEVYESEQRLKAATEGKLDLYMAETNSFKQRYAEHLKTLAKPATELADFARAEAAELSKPFNLNEVTT
jgi:hypothetical protein